MVMLFYASLQVVYGTITDFQRQRVDVTEAGEQLCEFNIWNRTACFLLLDECDHALIDCATSVLFMSGNVTDYLAMEKLIFRSHKLMMKHADFSDNKVTDRATAQASRDDFAQEVLKPDRDSRESEFDCNHPHSLPVDDLVMKLSQGALNTRTRKAGRHFLLKAAKKSGAGDPSRQDLTILIVDLATGIEQPMTRWTYEAPFVEMQHGIPMKGIQPLSFFSSLVAFVQAYGWFGGFSGTLGPSSARRFLRDVYQADAIEIPRHMPSRFYDLSPIVYGKQPNAKKKWLDKIAQQTGDFFNGALMARFGPLARNTCLQQMLPFALLPTPRGSKASRLAAPARFSSLWRACRRLMKCTTR